MDRVFLLTPMTVIDGLMLEGFLALGAGKTKVTSVQDVGHHRGSSRKCLCRCAGPGEEQSWEVGSS